jgi:hypothetical protein
MAQVFTRYDSPPSSSSDTAVHVLERIQIEQALKVADRRKDEFLATLAP